VSVVLVLLAIAAASPWTFPLAGLAIGYAIGHALGYGALTLRRLS
jgi:hypothetical protein